MTCAFASRHWRQVSWRPYPGTCNWSRMTIPTVGLTAIPWCGSEAGIKVRQLLADLESCGLCLPRWAPALARAWQEFSTATHGGDFAVNPLPSWVRAVHLVAAGGQEWFVTDLRLQPLHRRARRRPQLVPRREVGEGL